VQASEILLVAIILTSPTVMEGVPLQTWNSLFIDQAGTTSPMLSVLVLVIGVIILLLGWRLSRLVAILDFSLFGVMVGASLTGYSELQGLSAAIGAIAFGFLAMRLAYYGEVVACGLLAGMITVAVTGWLASPLAAVFLATGVAFCCAVALTFVAPREASAVMTAVQGGLLTAFGLAACLSNSGPIWGGMKEVLASNGLAQLMFLLAPIGVGISFQLASMENEDLVPH
jgi:hypothetical protein